MVLKNKKILITAGPTWVKIDEVRVISNMATGITGMLLANYLNRLGAKVTLLLGPVKEIPLENRITLRRYKFFDELKRLIEKELKANKYDLALHSAAVSDYRPALSTKKKIDSGHRELTLKLKPTAKIIRLFKAIRPSILLVGFKYEAEAKKKRLLQKARELIKNTKADLVLANTVRKDKYIAYLFHPKLTSGPFSNKLATVKGIISAVKGHTL